MIIIDDSWSGRGKT